MKLLDIFRKKITSKQSKIDKIWDLWAEGKIKSPYAELMTYQSEIGNGGHSQFFFNLNNTGELQKSMSALQQILPAKLNANLQEAYIAFLTLDEDSEDEGAENELMEKADSVFYSEEQEINCILEKYAQSQDL